MVAPGQVSGVFAEEEFAVVAAEEEGEAVTARGAAGQRRPLGRYGTTWRRPSWATSRLAC